MGQVSMDRESEIHGNRQNRVERRPRNGKRNTSNELDGIDGGSFAGFAPIPSGNGEFMAADGSMGEKFMTGVNNNDFIQAGDKKQIASELERRMLERSGGYDGGNSNSSSTPSVLIILILLFVSVNSLNGLISISTISISDIFFNDPPKWSQKSTK